MNISSLFFNREPSSAFAENDSLLSARKVNQMIQNHIVALKTIKTLEAEMLFLKESSQEALKQSFDEISSFQQQYSRHHNITNQLETNVIEVKRKEEYWHKRCLDAEFKVLKVEHDSYVNEHKTITISIPNVHPQESTSELHLSKTNLENEQFDQSLVTNHSEILHGSTTKLSDSEPTFSYFKNVIKQHLQVTDFYSMLKLAWQPNKIKRKTKDSESKNVFNSLETKKGDEKDSTQSSDSVDTINHLEKGTENEQDNQLLDDYFLEKMHLLEAKIINREFAVCSLKNTVKEQVKTIHRIQAENDCMIETLKMKDINKETTHCQKESFLGEQLSMFQDEIRKRDKYISLQKERENGYRKCIDELASELELMFGMFKQAERNGIDLLIGKKD